MKRRYFLFIAMSLFISVNCSDDVKDSPGEDCHALTIDMNRFENLITDPTTSVENAEIKNGCLVLSLMYTGGCEEHEIELVSDGAVAESFPPQMWFYIHHDNTDPCDAVIRNEWKFSLEQLEEYVGEVIIHLDGWNENLHYVP